MLDAVAPIDSAACRWLFRSFGSTVSVRPEIILLLEEVVSAFLSRRIAFFQRVLQMASFCERGPLAFRMLRMSFQIVTSKLDIDSSILLHVRWSLFVRHS